MEISRNDRLSAFPRKRRELTFQADESVNVIAGDEAVPDDPWGVWRPGDSVVRQHSLR
jgi:hypothetical protein